MQALHSMYYLAKELDAELIVFWDETGEFCCSYGEVFEKIPGIKYKKLHTVKIDGFISLFKRMRTIMIRKYLIFSCDKTIDEKETLAYCQFNSKLDVLNKFHGSKIYCRVHEDFYEKDYLNHDMSFLKFKDDIIKRVEQIFSRNDDEIIGVHIRRTDHVDAIQNSLLDDFIEKIDACIEENENVKIYLATDDEETQQELRRRYGNRILIFPDKEFGRGNKKGVLDACVELLCLSKTKMIYGSYNSSYSRMAAHLSRIPLVIVKK